MRWPRTARSKSRGAECAAQVAGRGERRQTRGSELFNYFPIYLSSVANAFRKTSNKLRYERIAANIIINKIWHILLIRSS